METEIKAMLATFSGYIGTFSLSDLVNVRITQRSSFLVVDLGDSLIALAIYCSALQTVVYICDSIGALSSGLPPQLTKFIMNAFTNSIVYITNQLSSYTCVKYIILFLHEMSNNHSYSTYLSNFSDNLELNDYISNYLYKQL